MQLANAILALHSLEPPLHHGHITSRNILFDHQWKLKISDLGLRELKKYMSLKYSYSNKSQYTAPEFLEEKGGVVSNPTGPGDIYAFGMILYEIFTQKEPFKDISQKEIKRMVVTENTRPKISEDIPDEIKTLIRTCWQKHAELRPSIKTISEILQSIEVD